MDRDGILACYQRYRQACTALQTAAVKCVSIPNLIATAKHLGMSDGKRIIAESEDDLVLVYDLAVHTAPKGRSRAIDRYARARSKTAGDEAAVLQALCDTRFSLFQIRGRHPVAGLILEDLLRGGETWLVDVNLEATAEAGAVMAMRLAKPDDFAISCGVAVPIDDETLDELFDVLTDGGEIDDLAPIADEPLFAQSVYQLALELGLTSYVGYRQSQSKRAKAQLRAGFTQVDPAPTGPATPH